MAPIYDYKALDAAGKNTKGTVEGENAKAARQKLKKQGIMVTDMWEKSTSTTSREIKIPFFSGRVSAKDTTLMTRQLASLIKANIPLVECLNALTTQMENDTLRITLDQVKRDVNEGSGLGKALGKHPKVFDNIFINMVEAGESSGTLALVMIRLAELKEAQLRLRNKVVAGMSYPALMMGVGGLMMIAIFTFVIPKMTSIFTSMNKPVPLITQILINISSFLIDWWFAIFAVEGILFWLFYRYIKSANGAPKWDAFKLKLPIFGDLIRLIAVTRFSRTMATLLGTGVPILGALNISKNLVGSIPIENAIQNARENITEGQSIAEPLKRSGEFPPMVIHMIAIGEKTGELPDMLRNVADTYEDQVNARIESLTSLLEPLMIVVMGGVVGLIIVAIFVPLMDMMDLK